MTTHTRRMARELADQVGAHLTINVPIKTHYLGYYTGRVVAVARIAGSANSMLILDDDGEAVAIAMADVLDWAA